VTDLYLAAACAVLAVVALVLAVRLVRSCRETRLVAKRCGHHLTSLCTEQYEHRYEDDYPCKGCYEAVDLYERWLAGRRG
jgi:hypothetical protein